MNLDRLLDWYNRLPARNLLVAGVAALAVVASFQAFASSGQYQAGPESAGSGALAWSVPGRYYLGCEPRTPGEKCQIPKDDQTAVYATGNYGASYRTIDLPAGAYTLKIQYGNIGQTPPNYSYSVRVTVNGRPITAAADGGVLLSTGGPGPWTAEFPVTLTAGETTIGLEWTNDTGGDGYDSNLAIREIGLISKQATEEAAQRDDQRRHDLNRYRGALAQYVLTNGSYPVQNSPVGMTESNEPYASLEGRFINTFLIDPGLGAYYYVGNGSRYGLCADLESEPGVRYEVGPSGSRQANGPAEACSLLN